MAEKHQRLQADKKGKERDSKAWSGETKASKEIFQEFLLTWSFALPHYSQHTSWRPAGSAAFGALHIYVTAPKFTQIQPHNETG